MNLFDILIARNTSNKHTPSGIKIITENGEHDVDSYSVARVEVSPSFNSYTSTVARPFLNFDSIDSMAHDIQQCQASATISITSQNFYEDLPEYFPNPITAPLYADDEYLYFWYIKVLDNATSFGVEIAWERSSGACIRFAVYYKKIAINYMPNTDITQLLVTVIRFL